METREEAIEILRPLSLPVDQIREYACLEIPLLRKGSGKYDMLAKVIVHDIYRTGATSFCKLDKEAHFEVYAYYYHPDEAPEKNAKTGADEKRRYLADSENYWSLDYDRNNSESRWAKVNGLMFDGELHAFGAGFFGKKDDNGNRESVDRHLRDLGQFVVIIRNEQNEPICQLFICDGKIAHVKAEKGYEEAVRIMKNHQMKHQEQLNLRKEQAKIKELQKEICQKQAQAIRNLVNQTKELPNNLKEIAGALLAIATVSNDKSSKEIKGAVNMIYNTARFAKKSFSCAQMIAKRYDSKTKES